MIVALAHAKGGVGKSTLAVHLAVWWKEQGGDVALVDADVQGAASVWLRKASPQTALFRLETADALLEEVPLLKRKFDHLAIDGPAGLCEVTRAMLLVADLALLPCGPSLLDVRAANAAIRLVKQAQQVRGGLPRAVLVPNKLQVQYRLSRELLETVKSMEIPATPGLRLRQTYADAAGQGAVVWSLGRRGRAAANEIRGLFDGLFR
ncbi:MAG TPA: AAA family ATPase [Candidatus Paceibacterota bacterium]|nr:AAA family ATPase [Verrucomicrobiota bacterium]HRY49990.1 AAA family ATPase [Candidatus Paceibacterota bacterium]